jgi:hypothetical protein
VLTRKEKDIMAYTWGEIQVESLKKMFLNNDSIFQSDLSQMKEDNKYKIYLNAMPQACNEGIAECLKRGRPYFKTFEFTQYPTLSVTGNGYKTVTFDGEHEYVYESEDGLAYYFEVDNVSNIKIEVLEEGVWVTKNSIENRKSNPGKFVEHKGFIENPDKKKVRIVFGGIIPYHIRNIAIYHKNYNLGDNKTDYIPDYKPYNIYDLTKVVKDFYKIEKLYHEDEVHELVNRNDYVMQDDKTLVIDERLSGNFILKYQPYPQKITLETDDDTKIQLEDEVALILPLYIASQLYKDDDIAMATMYRNEFETALENMYPTYNDLKFVNKSGWL